MSRLLDRLRRQRPEPPAGGADPAGRDAPDVPLGAGAAGRAIVLETLSGSPVRTPSSRRAILPAIGVLGLVVIVVYAIAAGRVVNRPKVSPPPRPESSTASPASVPVRAGTSSRAPQANRSGARSAAPHRDVNVQGEPFARALAYQQRGDVDHAIAGYRAVLEADDSNVQAHNNLGLLYQGQGRMVDAIGEFNRAIAIDPGYARARNNLGVALMRSGRIDEAAGEFRRVLSADPRNRDATINLGLSQRAAGRSEEARETLIRAIAIDSHSAVAHYNLALLYDDAYEVARALDHYQSYLGYASGTDAAQVAAVRERCEALRQRLIK